jgi:putative ABC transport system substrate-binding protein
MDSAAGTSLLSTLASAFTRARWASALLLCAIALWAMASQAADSLPRRTAFADTGGRYVLAREKVDAADRSEASGYLVRPVMLAELTDQVRRQGSPAGEGIAVIYPDLDGPYRGIFASIIDGIEQKTKMKVVSYAIGPDMDAAALNAQLKHNGTRVVIALGKQGVKTAASLDREIPVVVGGVLSVPEASSRSLVGVSLTPDPALLFSRLKNMLPAVKRVTVIYDPRQNEWLIKLAHEAAKAQGLELVALEAQDIVTAAHKYKSAFETADARRDAIWLPQDSTTVDENVILPMVLKDSWERGIPVFSSSFLHVKKGVLFALYPNNLELGRTLAELALDASAGEASKHLLPLRDVYAAVNVRTASHIGLNIGYQKPNGFDAVFPEP